MDPTSAILLGLWLGYTWGLPARMQPPVPLSPPLYLPPNLSQEAAQALSVALAATTAAACCL
jgi:hypothetical protein